MAKDLSETLLDPRNRYQRVYSQCVTRKSPLLFDGFIQMLSTGWNIGRGLYCNLETELMASTLAQEVAGGEEFEMFIIEYQGRLGFCNKTLLSALQ